VPAKGGREGERARMGPNLPEGPEISLRWSGANAQRKAMISIQELEFHYPIGDFRLKIPEFSVTKGEKVAVIGPSGSGKTTLLNLIAGIITPKEGTVSVNNIQVSQLSDAERRDFRITNIGFVFQDFELLDYLNIMDNILHSYRITGALTLDKGVRARGATLAEEMGIDDMLRRGANDLSHGEKQRAAICRALLPQPKLILADEATGNLDPVNKTRILDLLFRSVEDHDATLLAVTHDYELLKRFDRVVDFADFGGSKTA
jgi:putative ABC transport system ATP-binding protein